MDTNQAAELLQSAAAAAAAGRLISLGLARRFPALLAWLLNIALATFIGVLFDDRSAVYFWFYIGFLPVEWILGVLSVRELFGLVFRDYPGIRTTGRWATWLGVVLATAATLLLAAAFQRTSTHGSRHLFYFEVAQRSVVFSLALLILTVLFFLSKYPLHLRRNTYISSCFFCFYFLSEALRLLIDSLAPYLVNTRVDLSESMVLAACLVSWGVLLRRETELAPVSAALPTAHEEELLHQLEALNSMLSRTVRQGRRV